MYRQRLLTANRFDWILRNSSAVALLLPVPSFIWLIDWFPVDQVHLNFIECVWILFYSSVWGHCSLCCYTWDVYFQRFTQLKRWDFFLNCSLLCEQNASSPWQQGLLDVQCFKTSGASEHVPVRQTALCILGSNDQESLAWKFSLVYFKLAPKKRILNSNSFCAEFMFCL